MYDFEDEAADKEQEELDQIYFKIFKKDTIDAETRRQLQLMKQLVETWVDEYFAKVDAEYEAEKLKNKSITKYDIDSTTKKA